MIKTLSPYYISVPLINPTSELVCDSYTVNIYVWQGSKTAVPSTPDYTITKINAAGSSATEKLNIARIVNDFIDFSCVQSTVTSLEDGNNQAWVKFVCYYSDQPELPQLVTTQFAVKGYGYFMEGENPQIPANKILIEGDEFKVNRGGYFVLPIEMTETPPDVPEFIITDITGGDTITYTITFETDDIYLRYRQDGDTDWIFEPSVFSNTSPITFEIPLTGDVEVQLFAYDALTDTFVYSNIFDVTI